MRIILFLSLASITQWIFPNWFVWILCLIFGWSIGYSPLHKKSRSYAVAALGILWGLAAFLGDASEKFYISHTLRQISGLHEAIWYGLTVISIALPAFFFVMAGQRLRRFSQA